MQLSGFGFRLDIRDHNFLIFGYGLGMEFMEKFRIGSGLQNFHICTPRQVLIWPSEQFEVETLIYTFT